ncbi:hypothetical protein J4731_15350 [Providencia rettgeri]|nr:hypothetical protein [Providencia rettgeri]
MLTNMVIMGKSRPEKWLEYLEKSAKFNQESALEELIDYYQQDQYLNANKQKS